MLNYQTPIQIKRQKQIAELLIGEGALAKLGENDLACLLGYVQGMIANAELSSRKPDKAGENEKEA